MIPIKTAKILSWLLLLLIITSSCIVDPEKNDTQVLKNISVEEAYRLIEENKDNPDFTIIDLRTESEYNQGYILNAINIDYYSHDFSQTLKSLDKSKTYLIYCRSGNRSGNTLDKMKKLDFEIVYNLAKGIIKWIEKGYPIVEECPVCTVGK